MSNQQCTSCEVRHVSAWPSCPHADCPHTATPDGAGIAERLRHAEGWFCEGSEARLMRDARAHIEAQDAEIARLRAALGDLLEAHRALIASGDCGFSDAEADPAIIAARAALAPQETQP